MWWKDEKRIICTVDTLKISLEKENIKNTAIIIIGDVINCCYERSKLYDPSFSTLFRKGVDKYD